MAEYLGLMRDYVLRAYDSVNGYWVAMVVLSLVMAGIIIYFKSTTYEDRAVSKRSIRARHKKAMEEADAAMTGALEAAHRQGKLKREEVDKIYDKLRKIGYKEIGTEPSYGKPWYFGTKIPEHAAKVKAAIVSRLKDMGMSAKDIWDANRRIRLGIKSAAEEKADLVKAIREAKS